MSEQLLNDETLTTADIAHPEPIRLIPTPIVDEYSLLPGQAIPAPAKTEEAPAGQLFPDDELHNFRARWNQVQTSFVDEPRQAVQQADGLVANVVKRIAEQFSAERAQLEKQWDSGDNVSTEDLRQALRRYRSFFDRLLTF